MMIPAIPGHEDILARGHSGVMRGISWSPDGRYLAFTDREQLQDPSAVFLVNKETRERRRLTTPPEGTAGDSNPTFSGDGKKMAFVRTLTDGMTELVVLLLESKKEIVLQSEDSDITGLTWGPQNRDIIYATNKTGISGLWRVSAGGGESRALPLGEDAVSVAVSIRSHRLVYTRASINTNIWRIRFNGPKDHAIRTRLIASSRQEVQPAFSPDGTRIAFTSNRSGPQEIWICRSDGSDVVQLTHLGHGRTGTPRWSPDGRRIVFDSRQGGRSNIYAIYVGWGRDSRRHR